jgi:hypothetical protein
VAEKQVEAHTQDVTEPREWPVAVWALVVVVPVALAILGLGLSGIDAGQGLAFGGALLTAGVSFVGLVLKRNGEQRTAAEDRRENARREAAAKRGIDRLDVEAARQAAALLSTAEAKPADQATTAGALLSMARLGQIHLASSMLLYLWGQRRISDADGTFIVNGALRSDHRRAQRDASIALFLKTPDLTVGDGKDEWYYWPFEIDHRWMPDLAIDARYTLLRAWVYLWTESASASERYRLRNLTAGLLACFRKERDPTLRCSVARMLNSICARYPEQVEATETVNDRMETFDAKTIKAELGPVDEEGRPDDFAVIERVLDTWLEDPNRNRTKGFLLPAERARARSARKPATTRSPNNHRTARRGRPRAGSR